MSDLSTPDELYQRLAEHKKQIEERAKAESSFDPYAVLGMHADVRPYLENWAAYNREQRIAIAEAVNYLTEVHDPFADAGPDGYEDDRQLIAALPDTVKSLATD